LGKTRNEKDTLVFSPLSSLSYSHCTIAAFYRLRIFHALVLPATLSNRMDNLHIRARHERLAHLDQHEGWLLIAILVSILSLTFAFPAARALGIA
jgi:hypothetical protein